ncbi:MAG TPA: lanthionine synthetase LanC family protein [Solirubrobacteraceae bacterium]|jgi:uncharacterized protein YyaL (SSP411 family)|nr:lanthionine synthetase LanC family protein [Solirubrobacteraceae bacterium]
MTHASDPLPTAAAIAAALAHEAVWYRGQCNWAGPDGALSPALGDGTAGIALFLAGLHAASGGAEVRRTALGAIGQALAHAGELPADGLYDGRPGVAVAAARCALLLGDERLRAHAARLARAPRRAPAAAHDLSAGTAGTIAALLALARLLPDERLVARAARLGDELTAAARRGAGGWSWAPAGAPADHGLCGVAHGTAGAAWALLELFAATGAEHHRDAARRALDHAHHWFDGAHGDWPDLRGVRRREPRGSFRSPYPGTWRDGAPGIALVLLRAQAVLGDERAGALAKLALATTSARAQETLREHDADFTLAAGLAGSADALLQGGATALARHIGDVAVGRYAGELDGWPCGRAGGGRAPSLLRGHAGIGLFYLRLHDAATPSALLLAP